MEHALAEIDRLYGECVASVEEMGLCTDIRRRSLEIIEIHYHSVRLHTHNLYSKGYSLNPDLSPIESDYSDNPNYKKRADYVTDNLNIMKKIPEKLKEHPDRVPEYEYELTG